MNRLNRVQTIIFLAGGLLMVAGAALGLFYPSLAPYVFGVGAVGFTSMQMLQRYEGTNFTIRRLRRIMLLSDVLFLVAAVLMFASLGNSLGIDHITYMQYVYHKWVPVLMIAAVLQLYATHRIDSELAKEAKKL
jgi:hypothetical protein